MANNPRSNFPTSYGGAVPSHLQLSHRARLVDNLYPGNGNPQTRYNRMLQGSPHANSLLPSEQFSRQAMDPRMNESRLLQSQPKAASSVPAHQQQQVFTSADQQLMRPQPGTPTHHKGWPAGNEAVFYTSLPNASNHPANFSDTQRTPTNGVSLNGLSGPSLSHTKLPPGAALLLRPTFTSSSVNGGAQSPSAPAMSANLPRSIPDATPGSQSSPSVGDSAPFQIPLSGPTTGTLQTGAHAGSGPSFVRTDTQQIAPPPFVNATNQQLVPRGLAHPNAPTNSQSLSASEPRASQSPARSATATPSSSANPPPLVDSRDSLQVQIQKHQHPPQPPHQQGIQLHLPGSTLAPLPPMQQPSESAIRQQQMLSQRGQFPRPSFPAPIPFSNPTHILTPAQQHVLFPYQANPDNGPSARSASQPSQSRPSSTGGSGAQGIGQPTEPAGRTPSREEYSEQPSAGLQPSQSLLDASSQSSARPPAATNAPGVPHLLSDHPGSQQTNGSPGLPRPTIPLVSNGIGILKVLEFCTAIANKKPEASVAWWQSFVQTFVHPSGFFDITLWVVAKNRNFHLKSAILGRFFHRMFSCGIQDLNISFHNPKETPDGASIRVNVDAAWMFIYSSGYTVTLSGPLEVAIHPMFPAPESNGASSPDMRFSVIRFAVVNVDKKIDCKAIEGRRSAGEPGLGYENFKKGRPIRLTDIDGGSPSMGVTATRNPNTKSWIEIERAKLPPDPVNEYGIPHSLHVCLDLSDSIGELTDLLFKTDRGFGPKDSFNKVVDELRAQRPDLAEKPPAAMPPPAIANTLNTALRMMSSPMQIDRPAPTQNSGPHQNSNASPKPSDSASDSSNLSSPPTSSKRKSIIMEEPEQSISASDPPPSSGRRRNNTSDSGSTLSARSTRQQHRRQTSPRPGIRSRRRGGTS